MTSDPTHKQSVEQ